MQPVIVGHPLFAVLVNFKTRVFFKRIPFADLFRREVIAKDFFSGIKFLKGCFGFARQRGVHGPKNRPKAMVFKLKVRLMDSWRGSKR